MIDKLLEIANGKPAFVFISSAKDSLIPVEMKKEYLTKMLTRNGRFPPNLQLINTSECPRPCGGPLGGWGYIKDNLGKTGPSVRLLVGSDQYENFKPKKTSGMWSSIPEEEHPSIQEIPRAGEGAATFSSTKARKALAERGARGLDPFLQDGTNAVTTEDVDQMAKALLDVRNRWPVKKGGSTDESAFDEDTDGGRRRKSRFVQSKRIRSSKKRRTVRRLR